MKIKGIEAVTNIRIRAEATRWGLVPFPRWAAAARDRGKRWAVSVLYRVNPRLSLLIGSLLVLLTLYVQGTVWGISCFMFGCGPAPDRGYSLFLYSSMYWPGLLGAVLHAGKGFYALSLVIAAFTLLYLFAAWRRPAFLRKQNINRALFVVTSSLALFFVSDGLLLLLVMSLPPDNLFDFGSPESIVTIAAFLLSWLCPAPFWGKKAFIAWTAGLAANAAALYSCLPNRYPHLSEALLPILPIYALVPLVLWNRYRVSTRNEVRAQWPRIRDGITVLYLPAILGDCVCAVLLGFWGSLVYFAGISLISLGYMQLAREANPLLSNGHILNECEEQQK